MEYIYVGKIVNTHGIKGEVRIITNFKYKEKALGVGKTIYIGKEKIEEVIMSYREHKQFSMITFKSINNINDVLKYKGCNVYTTRDILNLGSNDFLNEDIIGFDVIMNDVIYGRVVNYIQDKFQDRIVVKKEKKEYLIPFVYDIIETVDLKGHAIYLKNIKGLLE